MEDAIPQKFSTRYWTGQTNNWIAEFHPSGFEINKLLRDEINKIWSFITKQKANHNRSVTLAEIKEAYYSKSKFDLTFNEYAVRYIRRNPKKLAYRTIQVYKTFLKHLNEFNPKTNWSDLTPALIDQFNTSLLNKNLKGAARKKYFDKFEVVYKDGCKQLQIPKNEYLFSDLTIKVEKPKRKALSEKEMEEWVMAVVPPELELYRDQFTFLLYTGLYYNDLVGLIKSECLHTADNGKMYIEGNRGKNEERFIIPILPSVMAMIQKYQQEAEDSFFPKYLSEQKFNIKLKEIEIILGWNYSLSNKVGRHSFTDYLISHGWPHAMVQKMLGWSKQETAKHYYDLHPNHILNYAESSPLLA